MSPPNRSRRAAATALLAAFALVGATACETPLERAYGRSQAEHVARSIENPGAGQADAVVHSDGATSGNALNRYRRAERETQEPQPRSVININTGD